MDERSVGAVQIVSMLTGLFWEVEHAAIYKPTTTLKVVASSLEMQQRTQEVLKALRAFGQEFEDLRLSRIKAEEDSL